MAEHGVPISRVIHGGGIPQKNEALNHVYANVLGKSRSSCPSGPSPASARRSSRFSRPGRSRSIEEAQRALCPPYRVIEPRSGEHAVYERLYPMYRELYFALGTPRSPAVAIGGVLPGLRTIAADARAAAP